ncbi:ribonuclease R [Bradyrhizobium sp.]|uniref:ribonuclease R n=1 Tax=Bradyrhizobium sp. TaxID=376 RepID=UPI002399C5EB|nr:ribonuclease R [Bradyrhizobium sp.]MDE2379892.1 ribonuclease R [Bradyrhizobium sp.]
MKRKHDHGFPDRNAIVAFIKANPGKVGTREIAREFGLKNAYRAELKRMLRELADEGTIKKKRRRISEPDSLPPTVLADITGRDSDGELIASPAEWDEVESGEPPKIRIHVPRRAAPGTAAGVGDRALLRVERADETEGPAYRGRIIKVIDRAKSRILGVFRSLPEGGGRLVPVDKKFADRELNIGRTETLGAEDGDLVSVDIVRSRGFGLASGRVKEKLGSVKSEKAISLIAIYAHDIPLQFSPAATREADVAEPANLRGREDWRDVPLVTIDPPDAKDHDDAVHAEADPDPSNKGGFILHVAIADVAFYVRPSSALDRDALERGNSVYFPDRVVPMLPERISNHLCSLVPGEPRGALAVRMVIGPDGRKRSHSFHRVLMRSAAKLHYAQAQAAIDGRPDDVTGPLLDPILKPLYAAYNCVKRARDERDPLDLDLPERKILLKANGTIDRVVVPDRLDAHRLIEEFMILANVAAAEMLEKKSLPLIYRVHDEPTLEKVTALSEFLETLDVPFAKAGPLRPTLFNRVLAQLEGHDFYPLVSEVVLRAQAQAEYSAENYGHFGLNLRRYAHFTSPIRRYADLVVHRGLIRACRLGEGGLTDAEAAALPKVAEAISSAERRAMAAERDTADRLVAHFLADRIGARFMAVVSGATRAGLFVKLDELGADGFVPASSLGGDRWRFDEAHRALVSARGRERHRVGDRVEVRLVEAAPFAGALRFELLANLGHAPGATAGRAPRRGQAPPKGAKARARNKGGRSRA